MSSITLSKAVDVAGRGVKPATKIWYEQSIGSLISHTGDIKARDVTPEMIQNWFDNLHDVYSRTHPGRTIKPATMNTYARGVRAVFNKLVAYAHLEESPYNLRLPSLPNRAKKIVKDEDVRLMLRFAAVTPRNEALIRLALETGATVSMMLSMVLVDGKFHIQRYYNNDSGEPVHIADMSELPDGKEGYYMGTALTYRQKNNIWHRVFFKHETCKAILRYLRVRRPSHAKHQNVFWLNNRGEPLTKAGLYHIFRSVGKRAGVETFNPHAFRHALARRLVKDNVNFEIIRGLLGHSDITTTINIYGRLDDEELGAAHQKYVNFDYPIPEEDIDNYVP